MKHYHSKGVRQTLTQNSKAEDTQNYIYLPHFLSQDPSSAIYGLFNPSSIHSITATNQGRPNSVWKRDLLPSLTLLQFRTSQIFQLFRKPFTSRSQDKTLKSVAYHKRRALNKVQSVSKTDISSQRKRGGIRHRRTRVGNININVKERGCKLESTGSD
jgi:hypothetical protein